MLENRNLKKDLFAIGLLAGVAFLGVSLVTYHPADPVQPPIAPLDQLYTPDQLVSPAHESVTNLCGNSGALVADAMLTSLGVGAYFVVASLAWVDLILLRRQGLQTPWMRSAGWLLTLIGMTTCLALLTPNWSPGPIVGPGGYLGALVSSVLRTQFASFGAIILSISLLACGLLLYTDYAILRIGKLAFTFSLVGVIAVQEYWQARRKSRHLTIAADNVEVPVEHEADDVEEDEYSEPAIKISGRPAQVASADDEVEPDEEWESEEAVDEDDLAEDVDEEGEEELEEEEVEAEEDEVVVKAHKSKKPAAPKTVHQQPHFKVKKPEKNERDVVMHQLNEASRGELAQEYELPSIELLHDTEDFCYDDQEKEVRAKAKILEKTFGEFGFKVRVVEIETGPVIAQYEIQLEAGLRLSKITGLADDLAIALRVPSVRIVAPIPGKNTVGIEVPNESRQTVRLREVMELSEQTTKKMKIPLFLGKDVSGNSLCADLASLPHLLIAGRTGTGKSVCLNAIISSILMTRRPDEVRMLMIDPKMVELSGYGRLPHLMHPVVTDMKKAEAILAWAVEKMEERYSLLAKAGVRHITTYNQLGEEELIKRLQPEDDDERAAIPLHLPFIVIVADEMADLMMTAGKEVEQHIIRLAQKSRAVGIHLILATQKPTVDVITGLIKSNLPARIAFQVASRTDSRVVLDEMGAEKLLGNGDMLFLWPGTSTLLRGQGTYLGDDEIDSITNEVSQGEQNFVNELVNLKVETTDEGAEDRFAQLKKRDELYESAIDIVVREGRGSVSLLQRALGIGYGRAARLIDFMAEDNIVGPYAGSQAREVLVSIEEWQTMQGVASKPPEPPKPARTNVIVPESEDEEYDDEIDEEFAEDEADADEVAYEDETEEAEDDVDEPADVLDETDDENSDDDDNDTSDRSTFVPPPKSRAVQRRRSRTIRPHADDADDEPFPSPHWGDSGETGQRTKGARPRKTRRVISQVAAAPWEDEVASDWSISSGDRDAEVDPEDDGLFPTAIDTTRRRQPRAANVTELRIDGREVALNEASEDEEEDGPRIVVRGRRRSSTHLTASSRRRQALAHNESMESEEEQGDQVEDELSDVDAAADSQRLFEAEDSDHSFVEDENDAFASDEQDEDDAEDVEEADDEEADEDEYEYEYDEEDDSAEEDSEDEAEEDEDEYEYEYEYEEDADEDEDDEDEEGSDEEDEEYEYEYEEGEDEDEDEEELADEDEAESR